jgi:hypothetical protein
MKYQVNIIRYEGDKPILLKSLNVADKAHFVSWDNKTYPISTGLVAYVDTNKKIGYIFFEHDNINQNVFLSEKNAKKLVDISLTELGDIDKKKLEIKKDSIPLRLYTLTKLALSATELDMQVAQNVIATVFSRLKNFGGAGDKRSLIMIIAFMCIGGMVGYIAGQHFASIQTVIEYRNITQGIPSV